MAIESNEATVVSVTVRVRTRDGRERDVSIDPAAHDAVFWSMEAVDNFLLPFYFVHEGFEFIEQLRRELAAEVDATGLVLPRHKRICMVVLQRFDPGDPPPFEFEARS
ncbi:MAG: hypothetical protein H0V43_11575 [Gemmatimonadales bacterium]|nr:hypothetical protein [Gemmatimonadales bacterium]MBA3553204.1 hypothetical protein [Gemmatimonadales bacterium]